jgi:hypothetical protein
MFNWIEFITKKSLERFPIFKNLKVLLNGLYILVLLKKNVITTYNSIFSIKSLSILCVLINFEKALLEACKKKIFLIFFFRHA